MSEWNRGRDDDQRRYGSYDRDRREEGERNRWWGQGRGRREWDRDEQRSFGERGPYQRPVGEGWEGSRQGREPYESGGYGGGGYRSGYGGQEHEGQSYGGRGYQGQSYQGRHQGQAYQAGPQSRDYQDRYGGYSQYGQGYGSQAYGQWSERQGSQGANERVQRVSDGVDRGHFFGGGMQGRGEHRGRGPKNYSRSDERIREDVNDRLSDDPWLDASEIEVQVSKGEVTLTGTVNHREDKRRAEDVAERVSGVKHVQNNLRVQEGHAATTASTGQTAGQTAAGRTSGVQ